jgi:integral membrane protein (TIGR00529 family)
MEVFFNLILVFVVILILLRLKVSLGVTLTLAGGILGLISKVEASRLFILIFDTLFDKYTLELMLVLYLIPILEIIMRRSGIFDRMIDSICFFIRDVRIVTIFFPIFLGMLPSAGGARFSAPLTGEVSKDLNISSTKKSFINYWFRHIWEPVFPLYPGIILAAFISNVPLGEISKFQVWYPLFMLVGGWFVAFKNVPKVLKDKQDSKLTKERLVPLVEGGFPILFLLISILFFKLNLIISLIVVIVSLIFIYRFSFKNIINFLKESFSFQIIFLIFGVMYFKNTLELSNAIIELKNFFSIIKLNNLIILFFMPFLVGLLTGLVQALVGITFPLILPLITNNGIVNLHYLSFAFISGYAGVLLSPVHLCYLLTCEYFGVEITDVYPYLFILTPFLPLIGLLLVIL